MKFQLILATDDSDDMDDPENSTGLTLEAYDALMDAVMSAGFEVVRGPDVIR